MIQQKASLILEISLGIVLVAVLCGFLQPALSGVWQKARVSRTYEDMEGILQACQMYEAVHKRWPSREELLSDWPKMPKESVWGQGYYLGNDNNRAWVETRLPKGVGRQGSLAFGVVETGKDFDVVRAFRGRQRGMAWRLMRKEGE